MTLPYKDYIKIQNKYCIQYLGIEEKFLIQLIELKKLLEIKYPEIMFTISCREEFYQKYKNETISENNTNNNDFAYIRKILYNNIDNPIIQFADESMVKLNF